MGTTLSNCDIKTEGYIILYHCTVPNRKPPSPHCTHLTNPVEVHRFLFTVSTRAWINVQDPRTFWRGSGIGFFHLKETRILKSTRWHRIYPNPVHFASALKLKYRVPVLFISAYLRIVTHKTQFINFSPAKWKQIKIIEKLAPNPLLPERIHIPWTINNTDSEFLISKGSEAW